MNLPITLIERRRSRSTDPATSHAAAKNAEKFALSHGGRIVGALRIYGPHTAHELQALTNLTVVQIDRRTCELERDGRIRVARLDDGADMVREGFRVWEAV